MHHVFDEAEVPTGFPITVDEHLITFDHGGGPFRDYRRIGTVGVLAFAKHIEVTQADTVEVVGASEDVCVEFVDVFSNRIG